jgi:hypothetical protein
MKSQSDFDNIWYFQGTESIRSWLINEECKKSYKCYNVISMLKWRVWAWFLYLIVRNMTRWQWKYLFASTNTGLLNARNACQHAIKTCSFHIIVHKKESQKQQKQNLPCLSTHKTTYSRLTLIIVWVLKL